ncbi:MAG: hypothetical protein MJ252_22525 [archaeon]|nr:hypothetical protein [archaeon]
MHLRPETPLIRVSVPSNPFEDKKKNKNKAANNKSTTNENKDSALGAQGQSSDYYLKNFNTFMQEIINRQNQTFLSGESNLVAYVLSKYLQIPERDLTFLKKVSIVIGNDYGLLNQFGNFLPNLILLKLNNSLLRNLSDIGSNFNHIKCLQINNSRLRSLNGIICMEGLEVLDLEDNEINELIDLDMCDSIKQINLRKNKIEDLDELSFVSALPKLNYFCILDNPVCEDSGIERKMKNNFAECKTVIYKKEQEGAIQNIVKLFDEKNIIGSSGVRAEKGEIRKNIEKKKKEEMEKAKEEQREMERKQKEDQIKQLKEEELEKTNTMEEIKKAEIARQKEAEKKEKEKELMKLSAIDQAEGNEMEINEPNQQFMGLDIKTNTKLNKIKNPKETEKEERQELTKIKRNLNSGKEVDKQRELEMEIEKEINKMHQTQTKFHNVNSDLNSSAGFNKTKSNFSSRVGTAKSKITIDASASLKPSQDVFGSTSSSIFKENNAKDESRKKSNLLKPLLQRNESNKNESKEAENKKTENKFVANSLTTKSFVIHNVKETAPKEQGKITFGYNKMKTNPSKLIVKKDKPVTLTKKK